MTAAAILMGFLNVCLYCALVILIAFVIVWAWQAFFGLIDANVFKWGKIVVGLLCLLVVVSWLLSLLGGGPVWSGPFQFGRWH